MNGFLFARSELLSTFFPTWLWQGSEWLKRKVPKHDSYWLNAHAHPVLSTYYPPGILSSMLGNLFGLDTAFKIFVAQILGHYILAFVGYFLLIQAHFGPLVALFGAITFTFQAAHLKQQPCIVYTLAWFPWVAICPWLGVSMILLAGYYPLAVFLLPTSGLLTHDIGSWLIGFLIGGIQLVPFLKYLPKTIRGKVEAPSDSPTERKFYFGLTPLILLLLNFKLIYLALLIPVLLLFNKTSLFRVPQRALILSCYGAIYFSLLILKDMSNLKIVLLILVQGFDIWLFNHELLPPRPFCELWEKPSRAFNTKLTRFLEKNLGDGKVAGLPYPLFAGHINKLRTIGYCGSMQNNLMWKWRHSFKHDPFIDGVNEDDLSRFRIKYAFSRKKLSWPSTSIRNLYINPNYIY